MVGNWYVFRSEINSGFLTIPEEICLDREVSQLNHPTRSQPICTAIQIALVELLLSWGVTPSVVLGHSSGEIAAAYCVGGLSRESAWKVAYYRGLCVTSLQDSSENPGGMMSVGLSDDEAQVYLRELNDTTSREPIYVGCINSPSNVTISGDRIKLEALKIILKIKGIFTQQLSVSVAAHSPYMNKITLMYSTLIQDIAQGTPLPGNPVMFSTMTSEKMHWKHFEDHTYWSRNMIAPVKFASAMKNALSYAAERSDFVNYVVELGPHGALRGPIKDILDKYAKDLKTGYSSPMIRGKDCVYTALEAAGKLYCTGYPIKVHVINNCLEENHNVPNVLPNLPQYPFNHSKQYWQEGRLSKCFRFRKSPYHELIGTPAVDWNNLDPKWNNNFVLSENLWVKDHQVNESIVYPGAGLLVMALEAARQITNPNKSIARYRLRDVTFTKALVISSSKSDRGIELQISLHRCKVSPESLFSQFELRISSFEDDAFFELCSGNIFVEYSHDESGLEDYKEKIEVAMSYLKSCEEKVKTFSSVVDDKQLYTNLRKMGLDYGPCFQGLMNVHVGDKGEAMGLVNLHQWKESQENTNIKPHVIHPAALDSVFQLSLPALSQGGKTTIPTIVISKIIDLTISESMAEMPGNTAVKIFTDARFQTPRNACSSIHALTHDNQPYVIGHIEATVVMERNSEDQGQRQLCHTMTLKPDVELLEAENTREYCSKSIAYPEVTNSKDKKLVCQLALLEAYDTLRFDHLGEVKPHFQRYGEWMKDYLPPQAEIDGITSLLSEPELRALTHKATFVEKLHESVEQYDVVGKALVRIARNLTRILRGEVDALDLLFRDGLLDSYYQQLHTGNAAISQLHSYVDIFAHKYPDMKVLEIGAGTGGTTEGILHTLTYQGNHITAPRFVDYMFTDISPSFFEKAKQKFRPFIGRMDFAALNIENDPLSQGFEVEKYDMVIASNVSILLCELFVLKGLVGVTRYRRFGSYIRKCSKAFETVSSDQPSPLNETNSVSRGGKLVMFEIIDPGFLEIGFIFGFLPGWWLGEFRFIKREFKRFK